MNRPKNTAHWPTDQGNSVGILECEIQAEGLLETCTTRLHHVLLHLSGACVSIRASVQLPEEKPS